LSKKVHPGDRAGGFSDLEMIWLLYCAGTATVAAVMYLIRRWFLLEVDYLAGANLWGFWAV